MLRLASVAAAVFLIAGVWAARPLGATIQDDMLCWAPDVEFPVPCDEDE